MGSCPLRQIRIKDSGDSVLEWLKSTAPIAGAALGVGYGDNLNFVQKLSINDG